MAQVTLTAAQLKAVKPNISIIVSQYCAVAITAGEVVMVQSDGLNPANDSDAKFDGIALDDGVAGGYVDVLVFGPIAGFALTSYNEGDPLYIGTTDGYVEGSAAVPTNDIIVGRVQRLTDGPDRTKVIVVNALAYP